MFRMSLGKLFGGSFKITPLNTFSQVLSNFVSQNDFQSREDERLTAVDTL